MASERELAIKITGDARGLSRAFGRVQKDAGLMERGLGGVRRGMLNLGKAAAVATGALAVAGVAMGTKAANAASDLEEAINKTNEVFGDSSTAMKRWADDAAVAMGMTREQALEGASSLGSMLVPMGVAPKRAAEMSRSMTELASDMASFNNEDPSEMLDRIRAGLSGESEPLKRYGTVLSETRVQQHAWKEGLVATGEALTEEQKIQARYSLLLKDTAAQQGDFARTSDGMANASRIAKAQLGDLAATAGQVLVPVFADVLSVVNDVVSTLRERWPEIQATIEPVVRRVADVIAEGADWIRRNWDEISATAREVFATVADTIRKAVTAATPVLQELGRITRSVLELAMAAWDRFGEETLAVITTVFREVMRVVRPALQTLRSAIETVTAIIEGDWDKAWEGIKGILRNALKALVAAIRGVGGLIFAAMKFIAGKALEGLVGLPAQMIDAGKRIVQSIIDGIKAAPNAIIDAILALIPSPTDIVARAFGGGSTTAAPIGRGGFTGLPSGSRGAMLPGTYQGVDTMIAAVAPGEMILTPRQQMMADAGVPLRQALAMTGASFNRGGIVASAYSRAEAELGDPYGKPSLGQSRTGPNSWDCSGYATHVAQVNVGGTTASAYPMSSPRRGGELIAWGFRKNHSGTYRGGYDEHMGVFVNGRWFDAGSGGVESNADSARWQEVRIPRGLEGLTVQSLAGEGQGVGPNGEDTATATRGRGSPKPLNDVQKLAKLLGEATGRRGLGEGRSVAGWAKPLVSALRSDVPDVSSSTTGTAYTGAQGRAISGAARAARTEARVAGQSPEQVREAGEKAEREAELKVLRVNRREAIQRRARLGKAKGRILTAWRKLTRKPARTPKARAARKKATASIRVKLREFTAEINDLTEIIAEIAERMREIGEEAIDAEHQANYAAAEQAAVEAEREAEEAARAADAAGDQGPSVWDQLNAEAAMAELTDDPADNLAVARKMLNQAKTEYEAALAGGDPRQIGPAAQNYRSAIDRLEAMTPAPPSQLDFLNLAATMAQGTEGTEDDLASAMAFLQFRQGELEQAIRGGDPRQITTALQNLLAVQQQIRALTENTDALNDNTEAMQGLTGSVTFGFRGQDYVLRSLAPPSSDRIENLLVGA